MITLHKILHEPPFALQRDLTSRQVRVNPSTPLIPPQSLSELHQRRMLTVPFMDLPRHTLKCSHQLMQTDIRTLQSSLANKEWLMTPSKNQYSCYTNGEELTGKEGREDKIDLDHSAARIMEGYGVKRM